MKMSLSQSLNDELDEAEAATSSIDQLMIQGGQRNFLGYVMCLIVKMGHLCSARCV